MKSAAFEHLLRHFRTHKQSLVAEIQVFIDNGSLRDSTNMMKIAKYSGALDCLYWQALGNDLTNFAKGIRRTLEKAKTHHGFEGV